VTDAPNDAKSPGSLAPPWLRSLQQGFGDLLRSPLDPSSGTFEPPQARYPAEVVAELAVEGEADRVEDRLALYHRQYWIRLFVTLQTGFPRTASAVGFWAFNHLAAAHLLKQAPAHWDVDRASDGFDTFVERLLREVVPRSRRAAPLDRPDRRPLSSLQVGKRIRQRPEVRALLACPTEVGHVRQALRVDAADRASFAAPWVEPWRPRPDELGGLAERVLELTPSVRVVRVDWDLLKASEEPAARLPAGRALVFARSLEGTVARTVPLSFGRLLLFASEAPFGEALGRFEHTAPEREVASLRKDLGELVQVALGGGWWV